jgi:hypothetical protein
MFYIANLLDISVIFILGDVCLGNWILSFLFLFFLVLLLLGLDAVCMLGRSYTCCLSWKIEIIIGDW